MSSTALLVIDVQVAMFEEEEQPPYLHETLLANIQGMIERARAAGVPVMYVRHMEKNWPSMQPGHPSFEVHPSIAPLDGDPIFDKFACDSFYDTGLEAALRERGIDTVVISGLQTEMCVDTASRSALHRDFDVILASDAHSTWSRADIDAATIITHHNFTLKNVPHPTKSIVLRPSAEITF